jgi:16S rRNA (adenine1518-N6/adenine1519-N6)-dimethyltransferase
MEVDREAVEYLQTTFPGISDRLIHGDFLKYDFSGFPPVETHCDASLPKFTVIGNFPYNISTQILFTALDNRDRIPEVVGMFQKEVAERIASPPGNKSYGIISVLLQAFYDIEYLFTVSETVFYPPPKVKSAVIRLRRNATMKLDCDEELFTRLVKTAFNQRRKTLRNAIRQLIPASLAEPSAQSEWMASLLDLRAERLSVDDFVRLARELATFA